jgi:gas vesicle protein
VRKFFSFLSGTLLGAIVGAVLALLLAPLTGESFREQLQERAKDLRVKFVHVSQTQQPEQEADQG